MINRVRKFVRKASMFKGHIGANSGNMTIRKGVRQASPVDFALEKEKRFPRLARLMSILSYFLTIFFSKSRGSMTIKDGVRAYAHPFPRFRNMAHIIRRNLGKVALIAALLPISSHAASSGNISIAGVKRIKQGAGIIVTPTTGVGIVTIASTGGTVGVSSTCASGEYFDSMISGNGVITGGQCLAVSAGSETNTYTSSKTFTHPQGVKINYGLSVGSFSIVNSAVVPASGIQTPASIAANITSLGAASVYSGVQSNIQVTDTANHATDAAHVIGLLGVSTSTPWSRVTQIGVEGRANILDASPTSTSTLIHLGVLGYANAYDPLSKPDNNYIVGVEGRARKTTASDGGGANISTGVVIGFYAGSITGGAVNYGMYLSSGQYNYLGGYLGIQNVVPSFPLDINAYDGTNFGTARFRTGAAGNPLAIYWGRDNYDLIQGISGGTGQFLASSEAGDAYWRGNGGKMLWTGDSSGNRTDITLTAGGLVGFGTGYPATTMDVAGNAQFGTTGKSTFSTSGALSIAVGADVTLTGPSSEITAGSSVTASAFFGDGSALTGLSSSEANTYTSSKTFTANVHITPGTGINVGTSITTATPCGTMFFISSMTTGQIPGVSTTTQGTADTKFSTYTVLANSLREGDAINVECAFANAAAAPTGVQQMVYHGSTLLSASFFGSASMWGRTWVNVQQTGPKNAISFPAGVTMLGFADSAAFPSGQSPQFSGTTNQSLSHDTTVDQTYYCAALRSGGGSVNFLYMKVTRACN